MTAKNLIRSAVSGALATLPLSFWMRRYPKDAIVLNYHVVADEALEFLRYYGYKSSSQFEADVAYAAEAHGFVDYESFVEGRRRGKSGDEPWNRVLFTFDDGFACCADTIAPILSRYGAPGIFFVVADFIDNRHMFFESKASLCLEKISALTAGQAQALAVAVGADSIPEEGQRLANARLPSVRVDPLETMHHHALVLRLLACEQNEEPFIDDLCARLDIDPLAVLREQQPYLTTEQIRQMAADGFIIGSHGMSHRLMQLMTPDEMERDIVESCQRVQAITGQSKVPFAFPYGGHGIDRAFLAAVLERHPVVDLFYDTAVLQADEPHVIQRLSVDEPPGKRTPGSNIPASLRQAWSRRSSWWRPRSVA